MLVPSRRLQGRRRGRRSPRSARRLSRTVTGGRPPRRIRCKGTVSTFSSSCPCIDGPLPTGTRECFSWLRRGLKMARGDHPGLWLRLRPSERGWWRLTKWQELRPCWQYSRRGRERLVQGAGACQSLPEGRCCGLNGPGCGGAAPHCRLVTLAARVRDPRGDRRQPERAASAPRPAGGP